MLAGPTYNEKLMAKGSRLSRMLGSPTADEKIIEEFYLAAFGRYPAREEIPDLVQLIAQQSSREEGLKDFIWALISSREFAENH